jgi:hypothetical protein
VIVTVAVLHGAASVVGPPYSSAAKFSGSSSGRRARDLTVVAQPQQSQKGKTMIGVYVIVILVIAASILGAMSVRIGRVQRRVADAFVGDQLPGRGEAVLVKELLELTLEQRQLVRVPIDQIADAKSWSRKPPPELMGGREPRPYTRSRVGGRRSGALLFWG